MNTQPNPGDRPDHTEYYRGLLHGLLDQAADMAGMVHQHARTQSEPTGPAPDTVASFDRLARCVRRTILLARSLDHPYQPRRAALPAAPDRIAARKRIIRGVEDAIQFSDEATDPESLHAEFMERLDSPDLEDDIAARPIAEIITEIRRDLGLDCAPEFSPWKRRTPADLASLQARAAAPRRPSVPPARLRPRNSS